MNKTAPNLELITTTLELDAFCARLQNENFVTVDTEFLRETTYFPKLCLIQIGGTEEARLIDPLADGIRLDSFAALLANEKITKVFHAAKQDFEIFYHLFGVLPKSVMDTQIMAMAAGLGDQVGYEAIVRKYVGAGIDKSSQFTDWSRRPLTSKQAVYALADVTHLRDVYTKLSAQLEKTGRLAWLEDDTAALCDVANFKIEPFEAWRRVKARLQRKQQLAVLMEISAWRENEAINKNVPRSRILKDDALAEIAIQMPQQPQDISGLRLLNKASGTSSLGTAVLAAVQRGLARDMATVPELRQRGDELNSSEQALAEVLKLALKIVCDKENIAPKLLANAADIEALAQDADADIALNKGWRFEIFGKYAQALREGKAGIFLEKGRAVLKLV